MLRLEDSLCLSLRSVDNEVLSKRQAVHDPDNRQCEKRSARINAKRKIIVNICGRHTEMRITHEWEEDNGGGKLLDLHVGNSWRVWNMLEGQLSKIARQVLPGPERNRLEERKRIRHKGEKIFEKNF